MYKQPMLILNEQSEKGTIADLKNFSRPQENNSEHEK